MRVISSAVLALCLLACGACGDSGTSASSAIYFKLDANSCAGLPALTINFFIDGNNVGSGSLQPGGLSRGFPVSSGSHILSARVANIDYGWPNLTGRAASGSSFTYLLICS